MDNQETQEQKTINELEAQVFLLRESLEELKLVNTKLGYSTKIMSEFHLTQDDKENIANSIDMATNYTEVKAVYDEYYKLLNNKSLKEGMEEFQMSPSFKDNIINYLTLSKGYDPFEKLADEIVIVKQYFDFENKIRSTPDAGQRLAMTDKLLESRVGTIEALNRVIDTVNEFIKTQ